MDMLEVMAGVFIDEDEVELSAIRSQGSGGQNVNKVATAIHLRFDISNSSLPGQYKEKLLSTGDSRISKQGILIIKAQSFRTQEKNKKDAFERLIILIKDACVEKKPRKPTRATKNSQIKRVDSKVQRGRLKELRSKKIE